MKRIVRKARTRTIQHDEINYLPMTLVQPKVPKPNSGEKKPKKWETPSMLGESLSAVNKFAMLSLAVPSCTVNLLAQGTISINNLNGYGDGEATSFGLFFDWNGTPYSSSPINVSVYGGLTPTNIVLIATLAVPNALVTLGGGKYYDYHSTVYVVPGVTPGGNAWLQVRAWIGSAASYEHAAPSDQFNPTSYLYPRPSPPCAEPGPVPFQNRTGLFGPSSLDGMPALGFGYNVSRNLEV